MEIYTHIKDNFLLPCNISQEITKTKEDLKVPYDTNDIVQMCYKKVHVSKLTLTALGDLVTDVEIMRYAFKTYKV